MKNKAINHADYKFAYLNFWGGLLDAISTIKCISIAIIFVEKLKYSRQYQVGLFECR